MSKPAILVLADGTVFRGTSIGADGFAAGEVVFNTAISGYQEILTDPSYCNQIVTLTYPHIGNTGVNVEDVEASRPQVAGLVIRELAIAPSSWRKSLALDEYLRQHGVVGIEGIDTRKLTRLLRDALHKVLDKLQFGQVLLATVGSTAPFVGLLGTVWGIYHALTGIAAAGQITIDKVSGPVGEALIMTAAGLAVAIPAVLGYNIYGRLIGRIEADLEGFARDLRELLTHHSLPLGREA